ncbi:MAG: hypothetical protein GY769_08830 [bacterium]|nr:hypothetical protein [bacterium]
MSRLTVSPICKSLIVLVILQGLLLVSAVGAAEVAFSTFLGGSKHDFGHAIAPTPDGGFVIVGETQSPDFPTLRALQGEYSGKHANGIEDAFVVKLDATGSRIEFATYLGGSAADFANAVAVDPDGNIYVAGETYSEDFPTVGGLDTPRSDSHGFLTKISPDGQAILFSTFLGGTSYNAVTAIDYERDGRIFVSGWTDSNDFLGMPPIASEPDVGGVFVASVDTLGSRVVSALLLGGSGSEGASHLAWDARRRALWLAGFTNSSDFPSIRSLRQTSGPVVGPDGTPAGFLTRLLVTEDSVRLKSSSILPGQVRGLAVDRRGRPHLTFPKAHPLEGWEDMVDRCPYSFYFRIQASGRQLQNVQCLPARVSELAVDRKRRDVVVGESRQGVPLADPVQAVSGDRRYGTGRGDLYVAVLAKGVVRLLFGTYFGGRSFEIVGQYDYSGGLALSRSGDRIFVTGCTNSIDYPVVSAVQPEKPGTNGRSAAFVAELRPYQ